MKSFSSSLAVVALATMGVACATPRTGTTTNLAGQSDVRAEVATVLATSTAVFASDAPVPLSEDGSDATADEAPANPESPEGSGAPEASADAEAPAIDPEAGDVLPPDAVDDAPVPSTVQGVPSELEEPLRRHERVWGPEIDNIPDPAWVDPTVLVLARICVSEAGWDSRQDCAAIFQVLRNVRRNDETLMGAMRRASRVVSEMWEPTTRRHRWLVNLKLDGSEPDHFPEVADWDRHYRHRWFEVIAHARALIEGEAHAHPCPGAVIAWGGDMDDYLALQRNLIRVDCGDTANTFWKRPSPRD